MKIPSFLWTLYNLFSKPELWASGVLLCLTCGCEHVGTWPVGREPLTCPYCLEDPDNDDGCCVPLDGLSFGDARELAAKMGE